MVVDLKDEKELLTIVSERYAELSQTMADVGDPTSRMQRYVLLQVQRKRNINCIYVMIVSCIDTLLY